MREDTRSPNGGCSGIEVWDKTETREMDGAETPDIELIYDYSSSDSNDEGSIGQLSVQKSPGTFIQRRPLSRAG